MGTLYFSAIRDAASLTCSAGMAPLDDPYAAAEGTWEQQGAPRGIHQCCRNVSFLTTKDYDRVLDADGPWPGALRASDDRS
jgi:hypothetical protein